VLHFLSKGKARTVILAVASVLTFIAAPLTAVSQDDVGPQIPVPVNKETIFRKGMAVDFSVEPLVPERTGGQVMEGDFATISFRISSAEDHEPLQGVYPGVWVDLVQTAEGEKKGVSLDCKNRVGNYLQGLVGMRPMIDLNSYFVMVLNQDPSISVIDPVVGITGITSLYTSIPLERPGADWAKTTDEKWLYVTMPRAGKVAAINLDTFKVEKNLPAGEMPMRAAIQPDEEYLWIGNDVQGGVKSGVTVIDIDTGEIVKSIDTGAGHHEISFSSDSRRAFVTNRESGAVTVIDTGKLEVIGQVDTGSVPISVAYSPLSDAAYAADGLSGIITVIDPESGLSFEKIQAKPGLGPMRFSNDGRWGFVVNPNENLVFIIDASTNRLAHTVKVDNKPFQVALTETFAYIRSLDSERIAMINLQELNRGGDVIVNNFAAGVYPPGQVNDIRIADAMIPAAQDAAVLVASPADATVYYYMEGMNAPMGAFRNYGHKPRAVQIANRALKELEPGVYSTTVKVPMAGTFEIAFLNEAPQFLHCFTMEAAVNPKLERASDPVAVEYLNEREALVAGDEMKLRFRLYQPGSGKTFVDAGGVAVKYFRAPRFDLTEMVATHVGEGIYEATLPFRSAGSYYIYIAAPGLNAGYKDLNYKTVLVGKASTSQAARR
jgi:YVTN family beta-propeller protein